MPASLESKSCTNGYDKFLTNWENNKINNQWIIIKRR